MSHDSPAARVRITRRTFLGVAASASVVGSLLLSGPRAEAATHATESVRAATAPAQRPHNTLLGVL